MLEITTLINCYLQVPSFTSFLLLSLSVKERNQRIAILDFARIRFQSCPAYRAIYEIRAYLKAARIPFACSTVTQRNNDTGWSTYKVPSHGCNRRRYDRQQFITKQFAVREQK